VKKFRFSFSWFLRSIAVVLVFAFVLAVYGLLTPPRPEGYLQIVVQIAALYITTIAVLVALSDSVERGEETRLTLASQFVPVLSQTLSWRPISEDDRANYQEARTIHEALVRTNQPSMVAQLNLKNVGKGAALEVTRVFYLFEGQELAWLEFSRAPSELLPESEGFGPRVPAYSGSHAWKHPEMFGSVQLIVPYKDILGEEYCSCRKYRTEDRSLAMSESRWKFPTRLSSLVTSSKCEKCPIGNMVAEALNRARAKE